MSVREDRGIKGRWHKKHCEGGEPILESTGIPFEGNCRHESQYLLSGRFIRRLISDCLACRKIADIADISHQLIYYDSTMQVQGRAMLMLDTANPPLNMTRSSLHCCRSSAYRYSCTACTEFNLPYCYPIHVLLMSKPIWDALSSFQGI